MFRSIILTISMLFAWQTAHAREWLFHTVDVKDGLADNYVRDITTDSEGYIWLSTINGLSRYDGYRFMNFQPQKWGAWSGDVDMVRETADSTLWMIASGMIFILDRDELAWRNNGHSQLQRMGIEGEKIRLFYVDDERNLWVVSERGLYHYNYGNERLSHIDCRRMSPILHIASKNGATLVVTTDYKIYKVSGDYNRLIYLTQHPRYAVDSRDSRAMMDSRMNLWIYHGHEPIGSLWSYSLDSGQWQQSQFLLNLGSGVTVNAIAEDREGRLWVGTGNHGVYVMAGHGQVTRVSAFRPTSSHITCLYVDPNNTIWAGSAKLGAAYADLNSPEFIHISTDNHEDVSALMEDAQGQLWIGFDGGGIMRGNTSYTTKQGLLPSDNVTALISNTQGNILAGTYGGGISQFNGQRFVRLFPEYDRLRYVKAIATDRHGALWVATVDQGVVRITADKKITNYTAGNSTLRSDGILCLTYDTKTDRLYIGTSVGLAAYDCQHNSFVNDRLLDSLQNINATTLLVDNKGRLWIGSRDGLWIKDKKLTHITSEQGLTNNVVRTLATAGGTIWASTDNGLTSISTINGEYKCRPYFDSDGLHNIIFSNNAALTTRGGNVLLGSLTGYINIPANSNQMFSHNSYSPPLPHVMFTEFRINGNPVVKSPHNLTIDYGERLGVSISLMVPVLSHKARYLYRFKGDKEWMRAPSNMLYFASLIPGTHVLQVKAELPGMAVTEVSELTFKVLPPVWLSQPLILCYLLFLIVAIYLAWRAMRRRQKRELAIKQMELNHKKYEMEEQKISFFTNISHDIKTPLTMVMAPLEKIRDASLPAAVRTEIDVAWQNAHQLYDLVLELLDFRRLDEGKEKLKLSHGELVNFVRQTVHGFDYYAARKQIKIELQLPDNPIEMAFDENKMRRIITNLLSNACKYNVEGGSIVISLTRNGSQITLNVADTGIGIKNKRSIFNRFVQETHGQEQEGSGLGLHIVRMYVEMMGGSIQVADNKPVGTIFTIKLPYTESTASSTSQNEDFPAVSTIPTPQAVSVSPKQLTILVVEDNSDARLFLQRSLSDEYQVLLAANGKEALEQLAKNDSVSMIISDVMMPVMDGMELVQHIRKNIRYSHIPVILLTAKSSEEDIVAGLQEGVADYLTKPFSLNVLKLRISKILEWTQHVHQQVATGIDITPSEITVSSLDEELISHVLTEVEANISNPAYSVVQLSSNLGMTRGTLYKKLMAIVGKSPIEFIRTIRIKRGKSLLDQGRTNISEVANMVGLSPKMFAQYFRDTYGTSPSDYLKHQ